MNKEQIAEEIKSRITEEIKSKTTEKDKHYEFNEGRLNADAKWKDAIADRIKELKMFEDMQEEMEVIMKDDSINVMVERAMVLGYHYALNVVSDEVKNE